MDANVVTWSVVKFPEENGSVEAIPTSWISGNKCFWPPNTTKAKLQQLLEQAVPYDPETWVEYKIDGFRNNVYDDYSVAKRKARKAEVSSDLDSQSDSQSFSYSRSNRKIFKKSVSFSSVEEEEETVLPDPPKLSKDRSSKNLPVTISKIKTISISQDVQLKSGTNSIRGLSSRNDISNNINDLTVNETFIPKSGMLDNHRASNDIYISNKHMSQAGVVDDNETIKLLKLIIKKQNILQGMMSELMGDLAEIKQKQVAQVSELEVESIYTKYVLPIKSMQELEQFENGLDDKNEFNKVVQEISSLGGKSIYEFIYRSTEKLITNKFASEYSWLGRKGKKIFKNLTLSEMLIKSAMTHHKCTIRDVELAIQKWLKRCTERAKNRV